MRPGWERPRVATILSVLYCPLLHSRVGNWNAAKVLLLVARVAPNTRTIRHSCLDDAAACNEPRWAEHFPRKTKFGNSTGNRLPAH
jgi:hypothetical protein